MNEVHRREENDGRSVTDRVKSRTMSLPSDLTADSSATATAKQTAGLFMTCQLARKKLLLKFICFLCEWRAARHTDHGTERPAISHLSVSDSPSSSVCVPAEAAVDQTEQRIRDPFFRCLPSFFASWPSFSCPPVGHTHTGWKEGGKALLVSSLSQKGDPMHPIPCEETVNTETGSSSAPLHFNGLMIPHKERKQEFSFSPFK